MFNCLMQTGTVCLCSFIKTDNPRYARFQSVIIPGSSPIYLVVQTRFLVARARKQAPKTKRAEQPSEHVLVIEYLSLPAGTNIFSVAIAPIFMEFIRIPKLMISKKALPPQAGLGAQKRRSEAHLSRVSRDNNEVAAQSRSERGRWTFYETIKIIVMRNLPCKNAGDLVDFDMAHL